MPSSFQQLFYIYSTLVKINNTDTNVLGALSCLGLVAVLVALTHLLPTFSYG